MNKIEESDKIIWNIESMSKNAWGDDRVDNITDVDNTQVDEPE